MGGSLARINLSFKLGHLLCVSIGCSLKSSEPFSLVWAISQRFKMDPIIGGFIGLNVKMRGTFSDLKVGILGTKRLGLSILLALFQFYFYIYIFIYV
jgi:hypothetical protein